MKFKLTLLFSCIALYCNAQLKSTDLIGTWKVIEVTGKGISKVNEKKALEILRPNLMKTVIRFDAVGHGNFHFPMTGIPISENSKPSEEVYWAFNEEKQLVIIQEWKDRKSILMQFAIKQQDGNIYFITDEIPVWLKMKKS